MDSGLAEGANGIRQLKHSDGVGINPGCANLQNFM